MSKLFSFISSCLLNHLGIIRRKWMISWFCWWHRWKHLPGLFPAPVSLRPRRDGCSYSALDCSLVLEVHKKQPILIGKFVRARIFDARFCNFRDFQYIEEFPFERTFWMSHSHTYSFFPTPLPTSWIQFLRARNRYIWVINHAFFHVGKQIFIISISSSSKWIPRNMHKYQQPVYFFIDSSIACTEWQKKWPQL